MKQKIHLVSEDRELIGFFHSALISEQYSIQVFSPDTYRTMLPIIHPADLFCLDSECLNLHSNFSIAEESAAVNTRIFFTDIAHPLPIELFAGTGMIYQTTKPQSDIQLSAYLHSVSASAALLNNESNVNQQTIGLIPESDFLGMAIVGTDLLLYEANQRFARLFGVTIEQLREYGVSKAIGAYAKKVQLQQIEKAIRNAEILEKIDLLHIVKDNVLHWISVSLLPMPGLIKVPGSMLILAEDIRDERIVEQKYRAIVDTSIDGIWMIDAEQETTFVNKSIAAMLGYSPEEMLGKKLSEFVVNEELDEHFKEMHVRKMGQPTRYERRFVRKDGVKIFVQVSGIPLHDTNGKFIGSFGVFSDITEKKHIEIRLRESEARLRGYIEHAPNSIILFDENFNFLEGNASAANVSGYTLKEMEGKNLLTLVDVPEHASIKKAYTELIEQGRTTLETVLKHKSGDLIDIVINAIKVQENPVRFLGFVNNISSIKENARALKSLSARLSVLLENIDAGILFENEAREITYVNKNLLEMFCIDEQPAAFLGKQIATDSNAFLKLFFNPEQFEAGIYDLAAQKRKVTNETLLLNDGRVFARDYSPIYEDDEFTGHLWIYRDVTEKVKIVAELKNEQFKFETFANYTSDWEYWMLPDGSLEYMSPSCKRITGYSAQEFKSNPKLLQEIVCKEDHKKVEAHLQDFERLGLFDESQVIEFSVVTKNGYSRYIEHTCRSVYSKDNVYLGRRVSNKDITDKKISENYLRHSEQFMKRIYDNAVLPILVIDIEKGITCAIAGYNSAFSELVVNEDTNSVEQDMEQFWGNVYLKKESVSELRLVLEDIVESGASVNMELTSQRKGITDFWQAAISPVFNDNQQINRIIITLINITERRYSEQVIFELKERFESFFQISPYAISISEIESGEFVHINRAFCTISGFTREEIIGKTTGQLQFWKDMTEREQFLQEFAKGAGRAQMEAQFKKKDGSIIYGEIIAQSIELSQRKHILAIIRDITEERRITMALQQSEKKFRSYIEYAPLGVFVVDENGNYLEANRKAADLMGCTVETLTTMQMLDILPPESILPGLAHFDHLRNNGTASGEVLLQRVNGEKFWAEVIAISIPDEKFISFVSNIDDRRRAAEALTEREVKFSSFLDNLLGIAFIKNVDGGISAVNKFAVQVFERSIEHWIGKEVKDLSFLDGKLQQRLLEVEQSVLQNRIPETVNLEMMVGQEVQFWKFIVFPIVVNSKQIKFIAYMGFDISAEKKQQLALNTIVSLNNQFDLLSSDEVMQRCLDVAESITSSKIGFLHFIKEEDQSVQLSIWSAQTERLCAVKNSRAHYALQEAGIWTNSYYERRPVIVNNYLEALNKKGLPEGHCPLKRFITVPVFDGDKVVAVIGAGNKAGVYTDFDIKLVELLTSNAWEILARKRIEIKLGESEARFKYLMENSEMAGVTINARGEMVYANTYFLSLTGYEQSEMFGGKWIDLLIPEYQRTELKHIIRKAFRTKAVPGTWETEIISKSGVYRTISWTNTMHLDAHGASEFISSLGVDITEQKAARESLVLEVEIANCFQNAVTLEEVYGKILALLIQFSKLESGGIYLFAKNPNRLVLAACNGLSDSFTESVGCIYENDIRYQLAVDLPQPHLFYKDRQRESEIAWRQEKLKLICTLPLRYKNENIGVINLASKRLDSISPVVYNELQGTANQITSHMLKFKAEVSLKESEERYRTLLDIAPAAIILLQNGLYTYANKTALQYLGINSETEVLGREFFIDVYPGSLELVNEQILRAGAGENAEAFELHMKPEYGPEIYFQAVALPIHSEHESSVMLIGTDITDRKHAEERALRQLREKETLLKEIHHRVKNNLQIISSLLHLQSEYLQADDAKRAFVESLSRIRSMALIHERLYQTKDLSRIDISEYITDLCNFLVRTFSDGRSYVEMIMHIEKLFLNLDTAMPIGLIINELVSNAFKYAYKGRETGTLTIVCRETQPGRLLLEVQDDGVGFPDTINFRDTQSLGFQLVCSLVEQLRGTISLEKTGGSKFIIHCSRL